MSFRPKTKTINLMFIDGGLGDHIASLVAVNYIIKRYTWITPIVWVPDYLVDFSKLALPESTEIWGLSDMRYRYQPSRPTKTTKWDGIISPMKIHLVDYAFLKLCDENPPITEKNYLQPNFPKIGHYLPNSPYVVLTTGFTASVREWPAAEINKTAMAIRDRGLTPVFLGQTETKSTPTHTIRGSFSQEIDLGLGVNLIDKTNLIEASSIMSGAVAVMGVDNGLMQVAGCTEVPIIGGFTTVSPKIRMPIRHNSLGWNFQSVTPNETLDCRFCQQNTNFLYGHDYRNCLYQKDNIKHRACTKDMTAQVFVTCLDVLLKNLKN